MQQQDHGRVLWPGLAVEHIYAADAGEGPCSLQHEIHAVDRNIEISDARTGTLLLKQVLWAPTIGVLMLGVFGSLALILASIGLYGVMAYSVSRRRMLASDMDVGRNLESPSRLGLPFFSNSFMAIRPFLADHRAPRRVSPRAGSPTREK